jgi:hypothetical protein
MSKALLVLVALWLGLADRLHAQRRYRIGPTVSSIGIEDGAGNGHAFTSYGGSIALITGDDGESGLSFAHYADLSTDGRARRLTLYALDSYYYPIGTRGIAPFAATELGLARVTESGSGCLLLLGCEDTLSATSQVALGFGLGVRVNVAHQVAGLLEGRFLQVPGSNIQALEARANVSIAFGPQRTGEFLEGTLGPAVSVFIPVSGALRARSPFAGVRFRRDTKTAGTVGLQIDFAPLKVTASCSPPGCEPNAVLFAPGYEASVRPAWGRIYGVAGLLIAGVYTQGPDRGVAQGLHGGLGADLYSGRLMWNANARLLWLRRNSGENVFGVQLGVNLSPKIGQWKAVRDGKGR